MNDEGKKKKSICVFSLAYFPYVGGAEVAIKEITDRLPQYEFDLITLRFNSRLPRREVLGAVTVHRIGFGMKNPTPSDLVSFPLYINKIFFPVMACVKAIRLHSKRNYDALWSVLLYSGIPSLFFSFFYPRMPYLLTVQDGDTPTHITRRVRIRPFLFLIKKAVARAVLVQTISHYLADFAKHLGAKKTVVVPNGVDLNVFKRTLSDTERNTQRGMLGVLEDDIAIISVSRLVPKNGLQDLIHALPLLPKNTKLIIVGEGPLHAQLKKEVEKRSLMQRVIFVGNKPQKETARLLECADIFCRPSLSEGLGNVFLEAMAMRMPVIGTSVDGIRDFLFHQRTGWICNVNDPEGIATQVRFILDPNQRDAVAAILTAAYVQVVESYQWDGIARKMGDIFEKIVQYEKN